jgi:hypothetical protein
MADEWSYESSLTWSGRPANPGEAYPVAIGFTGASAQKFYQFDSPQAVAADSPAVRLERVGIPLSGRGIDLATFKLLRGIWLMIDGTPGDQIQVYLGVQEKSQTDFPTWEGPYTYEIGESEYIDVLLTGRFVCIRLESTAINPWILVSYELDFEPVGLF